MRNYVKYYIENNQVTQIDEAPSSAFAFPCTLDPRTEVALRRSDGQIIDRRRTG